MTSKEVEEEVEVEAVVVFGSRKDPIRPLQRASSRQGRAAAVSSWACEVGKAGEREREEVRRKERKKRSRSTPTSAAASKKKKKTSNSQSTPSHRLKPLKALGAQPPRKHTVLFVSYLERGAKRASAVPETGAFRRIRDGIGRISRVPAAFCIGNAA